MGCCIKSMDNIKLQSLENIPSVRVDTTEIQTELDTYLNKTVDMIPLDSPINSYRETEKSREQRMIEDFIARYARDHGGVQLEFVGKVVVKNAKN